MPKAEKRSWNEVRGVQRATPQTWYLSAKVRNTSIPPNQHGSMRPSVVASAPLMRYQPTGPSSQRHQFVLHGWCVGWVWWLPRTEAFFSGWLLIMNIQNLTLDSSKVVGFCSYLDFLYIVIIFHSRDMISVLLVQYRIIFVLETFFFVTSLSSWKWTNPLCQVLQIQWSSESQWFGCQGASCGFTC